MNARRGGGGLGRGHCRGPVFGFAPAPSDGGEGHWRGGGAKLQEGGVRLGVEGGDRRVRDKADRGFGLWRRGNVGGGLLGEQSKIIIVRFTETY